MSSVEPCPPWCQLFFDGLTSSAGVHRSIEKPFYWAECQQMRRNSMAADMGRGNLKIFQKQRSRLEGVELDKSVSNIYSRPPEAPDVQVAAALGQQALKFTESLRIGVGLICSSGTFCPLIPFFFFFYLHAFLFSCMGVWDPQRGWPACS